MATTTNYAWDTPDDTDLVKDGAASIRTLGSSIDTTTKALNPSTTLGDIEYRSATANTNTRLALGTAGQVLKVNSGATAPEWGSISASPTSGSSRVNTAQSTTSDTFTGLTTAQTVTITTGTKVLVLLSATVTSAAGTQEEYISVAVSGATTRAASDDDCSTGIPVNNAVVNLAAAVYLTCTAGSNTFTMQFKNNLTNNATFYKRSMVVIDLGS